MLISGGGALGCGGNGGIGCIIIGCICRVGGSSIHVLIDLKDKMKRYTSNTKDNVIDDSTIAINR